LLLLIILLFGFNYGYSSKSENEPIILNEQILKGFEKCKYSEKFKDLKEKAIKEKKPIIINEKGSTVTYKIQGTFYSLPIEAIEIGVCNEAKKILKKATGKDFTKEVREKEFHATLRPVLVPYEGGKKSLLFCDAGSL